jgi:hypothetical protein
LLAKRSLSSMGKSVVDFKSYQHHLKGGKPEKKANRNDPETPTYLKYEENQDLWREKEERKKETRKQGRKQASNV